MRKFIILILLVTLPLKAWGGVLEMSDLEELHKDFSRILHNLEDFYRANADQIKVLNTEEFFQKPALAPSFKAREALAQIKKNDRTSITQSYSKKPRKLKKHLLELKEYFKSFDDNDDPNLKQQVSNILLYTDGLLLILKSFWK